MSFTDTLVSGTLPVFVTLNVNGTCCPTVVMSVVVVDFTSEIEPAGGMVRTADEGLELVGVGVGFAAVGD